MEPRAIRTDEELDRALARIERYFYTPPEPGTPDADRFDMLTDLIEAYESRKYPIDTSDLVETGIMPQSEDLSKDEVILNI